MKHHSAIHAAVASHSKKKTKPLIKSVIKKTAAKVARKRPNVVQYGLVVRNNINVPMKKKASHMGSPKKTPKRPLKLHGSPAVHSRLATKLRATHVKPRKSKKETKAATDAVSAAVALTGVAPAVVSDVTPVAGPGGDIVSEQLVALKLNSPPVGAPTNVVIPPGGMTVLPASAVPWPPMPVNKIVDEPEPVTEDDKRIRIASDRQKQLQFAQQRQERTVYLESEINIAAQNGFIIDPAEIQRRRMEITAIGATDPSTKRAASIDATIIGKDPAKPSHMQRNFNILVAMTVILVFVALVTRPGDAPDKTKEEIDKQNDNKNDGKKGEGVGWVAGVIAGIMFILATGVVYNDKQIEAKRPRERDEPGVFDFVRDGIDSVSGAIQKYSGKNVATNLGTKHNREKNVNSAAGANGQ